ncbi:MAG TPA: tetratricopeptide repeat protein [Thermoplasmata archaeon]|nr:tetratricopeptide repeat protein [Thermoplasmata archaeon]
MATPSAAGEHPMTPSEAAERARRLFTEAEKLETTPDRGRYAESLRVFLAFTDSHRDALEESAAEMASRLDEVAMAFYRLSETDLASRAIDAGLAFAPGSAALLHHKALVLLAQNRSVDQALPLVEQALSANPHDKTMWATKGDALRLMNRPTEAAEAYLRAQQLDATSMQYVEKALRLDPKNPVALRMKLQLAKAHGGDQQALDACDALLVAHPDDPELLVARAELLSSLGRLDDAVAAVGKAKTARPDDPRVLFLSGRLLLAKGPPEAAAQELKALLAASRPLDATLLAEMADLVEPHAALAELGLDARERVRQLEPRNLSNLQALRALAMTAGKPDIAESACRWILEQSPDNLDAMRTLADLLATQGKNDEAFAAFRDLLRAHPHEVAEHRRAIETARRAGRLDLVVEYARGLLTEDPDDREALELLAQSLSARGDKASAVAAVDGLLKQAPTDLNLLREKKQLLTELKETDGLGPVLDELFRLDPTQYDLALERGHHYLTEAFDRAEGSAERDHAARAALVSYERSSLDPELAGKSLLGIARASRLVHDSERAVRSYQEFLALPAQGRRTDVMKELGHVLREEGRLTEAEQVYAQAIELGLEDADLFWGAADVLSSLNQDAKALRYVDLLLQREPDNPLFLRRKGQLQLKAGRRTEALETLKRAIASSHSDPQVHFDVGDALRSHGLYADAVGFYRQGLDLSPKNRAGRLRLAETLQLAGRFNEVTPLVDALLREDPNDLGAWKARADAARSLQRNADLQYSLKAILLLEPHNAGALQEKARVHLAAGEKTEAFESLAQLVDESGAELKDPAVFLQLGDLAADLGRVEEANRAYERAGQLDPAQHSEIAVRRGRLRLAAGRPDLALEVLDQALNALPAGTPRSVTALLLRAEILTALERPAEAQQVLEEVQKREPSSPVATAGIARALLDQGKHAEAKEFLRSALPKVPAQASLFLLLAEAEAGLGSIPDAIATVKKGLEALPKAPTLWVRLGELSVAKENWTEAAGAYAHALALDGQNPELHTRAGFVAGKLGHPNEALALFDRATQLDPTNKFAWSSRGLALLATGRPDDAQASFDRALALDSDFDPAKEGKKLALQRTRETQVERIGREALLLEGRLKRPITKNDLFVTLHVPFDLLEPVLAAVGRETPVDLERLSETEMHDLESASYQLITTALERRPEGIERRGFALSDVAVLSPPSATLPQIQRLFGYVKAVLEADLRPENLRLTPDVEELARKALALPENQRTLFQLVKTLQVGLFRARLIKAVESIGSAVHAPLPALDLGQYSPEFRSGAPEEGTHFTPEDVPAPPVAAHAGPARSSPASPAGAASAGHGRAAAHHARAEPGDHRQVRCVGCGGIATVVHECGAPVCHHCIAEFHTCPKCGQPIPPETTRPVGGAAAEPRAAPESPKQPLTHALRSVFVRKPATKPVSAKATPAKVSGEPPEEESEAAEEPPPPPRPMRREKGDDEPRL